MLLRWLAETAPDVVCLQELKAPQERFPEAAIRDAGSGDGQAVRLPGDEAARVRAENHAEGIPLSDSLASELHELAEELGVESPFTRAETR